MKKPNIKILQSFANQYFSRAPKIYWKKFKKWNGLADYEKKAIYINPNSKSGVAYSCRLEDGEYYHAVKNPNLKDNEQYFLILLHEIAHFKFRKTKAPKKYFYKIRSEAKKKYLNNPDSQMLFAENVLSESDCQAFRSWWSGSLNHWQVENWARKEFQRKRKKIKRLLNIKL